MITDTDFADNITLISDNLDKAQSLLEWVETAATEIGLHIATSKTEYNVQCTWPITSYRWTISST